MTKQIVTDSRPKNAPLRLPRAPGTLVGILVGLGSILGTGVFVSLGIGVHIAGSAVILGLGIAAVVALCSGLSSAQLAASGQPATATQSGTYEYGSKYLSSHLGFTAAWLFLCAKSASAATAALGISGYILSAFGIASEFWRVGLSLLAVLLIVGVVTRTGVPWPRLSIMTNVTMTSLALLALAVFILGGMPALLQSGLQPFEPFFLPASSGVSPLRSVLHAAALMFVAYSGYGHIAMMGEIVHNPARTIPRAIVAAILVALFLYVAVAAVAIANVGAGKFAEITLDTWAPLEVIATGFAVPGAGAILAVGAIAAMLGILFNLIQGLARLVLTMGRRKDMPNPVARTAKTTHIPEMAVMAVAVVICLLILMGDIRVTWSLAAFTILIYYAITNLAALQLSAEQRSVPRVIAALGLLSCLFLAFWVEPGIWLTGLLLIVVGHGWRWIMRRL